MSYACEENFYGRYADDDVEPYHIRILGPAGALWYITDKGTLTSNKAKRGEYDNHNDAYKFMQEEKHRWGYVMCWIDGGE